MTWGKGKYLGVAEALPKEDDLCNEGGVGHYHGDGTEHRLQVVRQLCPARIA